MATSSPCCPPSAVDDPRAAAVSVRVTGDPLDAGAAIAAVTRPHAGGIGVFVGTTRDSFNGREVTRLEYEAFTPLAERALARIGQAAARRYGLAAVAVWHRVGVVGVGEASVVIATSATHRREAMEAAAAAIAAVKARAPIWKQEWYAGDDRAWKENCECAHALPSVPAAALRGEGDHLDVAAWLGEQSPADVARVGSAAGSAHRSVEPAAAPAAAAPAAAAAPGLSEA
ncbi:hypothetical protein FNF29_06848 [Cafeteria roenbergensis]|uniref:Molybdopterin synthase catalytic subunit n=1 Tax=Cafeteria roenbergensis TaxID=33653 RepID=A0A5A8C6K0_CAFRO|nr:hypothetical protein FNF29_06848 [Cafeteria roenbergensis]|eukprot:KAA0148189.1 hypothetical protein FNF29_06848 [Cafeteria roenbergensis]